MSRSTVDLYVDPTCPFAWITSRWLLEACSVREVEARLKVMSLAVLNEGADLPPDYRAHIDDSWGAGRVALRVFADHGPKAFEKWYTAWGERYHVGGDHDREAVARAALLEVGLPESLMEHYPLQAGDTTDQQLRESHQEAMDLVGENVGTPVMSFDGSAAYFGPVITPAPKGEEAGRLLDALQALTGIEGFYELKRGGRSKPDFD